MYVVRALLKSSIFILSSLPFKKENKKNFQLTNKEKTNPVILFLNGFSSIRSSSSVMAKENLENFQGKAG